jgi:hypothetical protein
MSVERVFCGLTFGEAIPSWEADAVLRGAMFCAQVLSQRPDC